MKKNLALICLLFSLNSYSQKFHLNLGTSISKLNWKIVDIYNDPVLLVAGGMGLTYLDHKLFDLTTSVNYLQKGGKDEIEFTDANGNSMGKKEVTAKLRYVNLSNAVRLKLRGAKTRPYATAGIYVGYLMSTNNDLDESAFKRINIGGIAGVGCMIKILQNEFGVEASYLPSFNKLLDKKYNTLHNTVTDQTFIIKAFVGLKL